MNILYILTSYNLYGGTPKKTLDLLESLNTKTSLYLYSAGFQEFKYLFQDTGVSIYEGYYNRNILLHLKLLLKVIDKDNINIIQTQFSFGELLGVLIKKLRPNIKLIVSFETSFVPKGIRKYILPKLYASVDQFIYISEYVKKEKEKSFPILRNKNTTIIFNGTKKRIVTKDQIVKLESYSLLDICSLSDVKNIDTLIEMMNLLIYKYSRQDIHLYIAGNGPNRKLLEKKIFKYKIENYVTLLGHQKNIGQLLKDTDIFVHSSHQEGFGIVILEAMFEGKPILAANAGAIPEIIDHNITGLLVDPFNIDKWAINIIKLIENQDLAKRLGASAQSVVTKKFSIERYVSQHKNLYTTLMGEA